MTILFLSLIALAVVVALAALYRGFYHRHDEPNYPAHYSYVDDAGGPLATLIASVIFAVMVIGPLFVIAYLFLYG